MSDQFPDQIQTRLWQEVPCADDPFSADTCRAGGYDVYGDLLGKIGYIDYLYLLFKGERASARQARTLSLVAVALANPGPRDQSVHAAMAAASSGNPAGSTLMAAIAAGAGSGGGAREVLLAMQAWQLCGTDLGAWCAHLANPPEPRPKLWPRTGHAPGFAAHGVSCAKPVRQLLDALCADAPGEQLAWLAANRGALEASTGIPLAQTGVVAAALTAIGLRPEEGEMLTLMLRLPGAAAHALEQAQLGFRHLPFFELALDNDPARKEAP
ncbi:citrate synthase [Janthinobacterium sp. CG_23.3]|uniref:citryl-CoA lyase n=1 Tax=Janthinobacterium sp. CG_23.3 TaxID=3349634 RepID=UPI0038D44ADE